MKVLDELGRVSKVVGGFPGGMIAVGLEASPFDEVL
jgi:hypothetical protein